MSEVQDVVVSGIENNSAPTLNVEVEAFSLKEFNIIIRMHASTLKKT